MFYKHLFFFLDMRVAAILTKVDKLDKEIQKDIRKADKHRAIQEVIDAEDTNIDRLYCRKLNSCNN